jgi:formate-dependent nitrite reductase membrane component NrfD
LPIFDRTSSFDLFPHLWLVVLCSLALIALAALLGVRRIGQRTAALLTSAIAVFALLLEFLFLIQANSIQAAVESAAGEKVSQTLYGVAWGFWLVVATTIAIAGVGGFTLLRVYGPGIRNTSHVPGSSGPPFYPSN